MLFRFGNFELDQQRAELRGPDGAPVKLRRKTFDMLTLFAGNAGRIVSKQELTKAIWPKVHIGEDSLFQCVREIRAALGDEHHQMLKVVSGRGYLFDIEVSAPDAARLPRVEPPGAAAASERPGWRWFGLSGIMTPAGALAGFSALVGLAVGTPILAPNFLFKPKPPTIAVMPIAAAGNDDQLVAMAAVVTTRLTDGLAKIANIRVVAPPAPAGNARADYIVKGELQKTDDAWRLQARIVAAATGEVQPVSAISVDIKNVAPPVQQSRLAAGIGHQLAQRFNASFYGTRPGAAQAGSGKAAIEQAIASINRTTRERFGEAQTMLEKALKEDRDNVDVEVALAGLKMRGVQMSWYGAEERIAAASSAKGMLEHALRVRPNSLPALEAYCRFLVATNEFVDGLVACAWTLSLNPWDGMALYHVGMSQLQLGRFDDALETFKLADRYDTPVVSRWTWLLGAGIACVLMDRPEEAVSWLERSIAITPASGRPYMVLAAAYLRLGRTEEARADMAKALALRPGSTAANVALPFKNTSPVYRMAVGRVLKANIEAGLPER